MTIKHPDTFCIWPWAGLEINADGSTRSCCLGSSRNINDSGQEYSIVKNNISEIRNSQGMRELRASLLRGEKHKNCEQCWNKEKVPENTSFRLESNHKNQSYIDAQVFNEDAHDLRFIGISLGNICNLRCRICGPWASSIWASDELKSKPRDQWQRSFELKMLDAGQWPRRSEKFWEDLIDSSRGLKKIRFYGGEPMITPKHTEILDHLIASGRSQDLSLSYNTNGTVFPDDQIDRWKHFQEISIGLSIDNIGKKFEYERNLSEWDIFCENLDRYRALERDNRNIRLKYVVTVSVFNVMDLSIIADWISSREVADGVEWNILQVLEHFCIANLRPEYKDYIRKHLEKSRLDIRTKYDDAIDKIIGFMDVREGTEEHYASLVDDIVRIDKFRGEWLGNTHPELAELLCIPNIIDL